MTCFGHYGCKEECDGVLNNKPRCWVKMSCQRETRRIAEIDDILFMS